MHTPQLIILASQVSIFTPQLIILAPRVSMFTPQLIILAPQLIILAPQLSMLAPRLSMLAPRYKKLWVEKFTLCFFMLRSKKPTKIGSSFYIGSSFFLHIILVLIKFAKCD